MAVAKGGCEKGGGARSCDSSAASMVCCHVFVELGMTKPNWKCHAARQRVVIARQRPTRGRVRRWLARHHDHRLPWACRYRPLRVVVRASTRGKVVGAGAYASCAGARTLYAAALEEDALLQPQALQHLDRRELELARDGAALEDPGGNVNCEGKTDVWEAVLGGDGVGRDLLNVRAGAGGLGQPQRRVAVE